MLVCEGGEGEEVGKEREAGRERRKRERGVGERRKRREKEREEERERRGKEAREREGESDVLRKTKATFSYRKSLISLHKTIYCIAQQIKLLEK